jgi:Type 2A encapsulin shell protein SrpI-like/Cyclic nucleotide-binding domain
MSKEQSMAVRTVHIDPVALEEHEEYKTSLSTVAARNLATTTKTVPQMQGITSRWLLKLLPWVQVQAGTYRVNRRLRYAVGRGRVQFVKTGDAVAVFPLSLREIPLFRDLDDDTVLSALAGRFVQREVSPGEVLAEAGKPADQLVVIAHGKIRNVTAGKYGEEAVVGMLADGEYFGEEALVQDDRQGECTATAVTAATVMVLSRQDFRALAGEQELVSTRARLPESNGRRPRNRVGEADVRIHSGHTGEPELEATFVDYELTPREYPLSVAQSVLRIHTRVADLYNEPHNQLEQQLRLTIEALRERQEHEAVNNPGFGLLHNCDYDQRIQTHSGPPTPDDLDELITRRRKTRYLFAHPRTIAAIGREWNRRGLYPTSVDVNGNAIPAWRGVPIFPCNKIPITGGQTSSIIAMRTGEDDQGVVGLHQTGIPDEYEPSLSVRFMGINEKAVMSYLVSAYFSVAVLVPDALGILENVEIARSRS